MTLPEFSYPDQHRWGISNYADRLAGRILESLESDGTVEESHTEGVETPC